VGSVPGHRTLLRRRLLKPYIVLVSFTLGRTLLSSSIQRVRAERFDLPCTYGDELRYSGEWLEGFTID
jgi:hypothetical protein